MAGPMMADRRPTWQKPDTASVLDSPIMRVLRVIAKVTGLDDPTSQVTGLMAPM